MKISFSRIVEFLILRAFKLPGYRINPRDVWKELSKISGIEIKTSHDIFNVPESKIHELAKKYVKKHIYYLTFIGFVTGIPGGMIGVILIIVDIEEFIRLHFRLLQKLAYAYGLVPHPITFQNQDFLKNREFFNVVFYDLLSLLATCLGVISGEQLLSQILRRDLERIIERESLEIADIILEKLDKRILNTSVKVFSDWIGVEFGRKAISRFISKIVPILGGVVTAFLNCEASKNLSKRMFIIIRRQRNLIKKQLKENVKDNI